MYFNLLVRMILVLTVAVRLEAVTVNPLCPTNKIAPNRRHSQGARQEARTFGAFYDLLTPGNTQANNPGHLQEEPQNDEPDDCGEIEDYDENDISSAIPKQNRRQGKPFLGYFDRLFQNFNKPTPPTFITTTKRRMQTRPPTGGYFGTNGYRPPNHQEPSAYVKPVHEHGNEPHMIYRPGLVGVPNSQIVGVTQVKPFSSKTTTHRPHPSYRQYNWDTTPYPNNRNQLNTGRNMNREPTILSSFLDLLFK